ncbi:PTS sugar transporter subunit IIC, partial [Mogibacterium diversum]
AVASYEDNGVGGLVSQGVGTSMLQMGNIVRNPRIWIAPTIASAITGPIATCVFHLKMNGPAIASGMGTCGLVGPLGVYSGWIADIAKGTKAGITSMDWLGLILISVVLPAILTILLHKAVKRAGWVKAGDQKL